MRSVTDLRGTSLVGLLPTVTTTKLAAMGLLSVQDLLDHLPRRLVERGSLVDLESLRIGEPITVQARVRQVKTVRLRGLTSRGKERWMTTAVIEDATGGTLQLIWFNQPWREKVLPTNRWGMFAGTVGIHGKQRQLANPDVNLDRLETDGPAEPDPDGIEERYLRFEETLVPIYPAAQGFPSWKVAGAVRMLLDRVTVDDPLPPQTRAHLELPGLDEAYHLVHRPRNPGDDERGRDRLRFDEAFIPQLALVRRRLAAARIPAAVRPGRAGGLLDALDARLPFALTESQRAVGELLRDELARPVPMHRLLQGEVGSGKTVVALRAMLTVVDSGAQTALLAPTEALAQQHARSLTALLGPLAEVGRFGGADLFGQGSAEVTTRVTLLVGSLPVPERRRALLEIASGQAGIAVGTHALLQDRVSFAELGLVVVDEQHRFGVEQRAVLSAPVDGVAPHLLVMTATPIPRTVAMTVFGDLDSVSLEGVPGVRAAVTTVFVGGERLLQWVDRVWERVREEVAHGHQAFVVFPRIGEPGRSGPLVGDPQGAALLQAGPELARTQLAGLRTAVVHGRMPAADRDAVLRAFAAGSVDVLLSTTVIEVGIDVPNATAMVILDADRFGVSQLHQLRGRVGRSSAGGVCLLLTAAAQGSPGAVRVSAVARTTDGAELARLDLQQRREGHLLGAVQAGRSRFRLLNILEDGDVIDLARAEAEHLLAADPELVRHEALAQRLAELTDLGDDEYLDKA
jgi:ATP-dependent DNA helicase RecG